MDNYKIKVKDEAESKEAQELFFDLGYEWRDSKRDITNLDATHIYADDGVLTFGFNDFNFRGSDNEELTLPQLRDLVVLKRNDVKDATHEDQYGDKWLYLDERHYVYLNYQWSLPTGEFLERYELKPIEKSQPQDPALIGGADALRALADGKEVEGFSEENEEWIPIVYFSVQEVVNGLYKFRLKPQTIKLELELPKPFEPEEGEKYWWINPNAKLGYEWDTNDLERTDFNRIAMSVWRTEDEIKQVVAQLRKIRGANS
ncbi:hypothetical protein [Acinetobacter baumannii]|uniref:hypothetical protein n=1 Tax=Acinetobacter baumannii TaxID=470 RepID=UPI0018DD3127|nr:hypothetical protein [Acinetobacter baumannii]MBH8359971.1 hypothetical protein [Acinetobacter baumannii]MBH8383248.1 hypothetical protein [Acinetobacter baumannii]MBH8482639.1 hypothetical protein [Acinetobacter baumannii]MDC4148148.1 hypothetical protein [Acinetobacter baumannii]